MKDFEIIPHTADLKITVYGRSLEQLFENSVVGMFQSIRPKTAQSDCAYVDERLTCDRLPCVRSVAISSFDLNALLVDFLSELLTLSDIHNEAYLASRVKLTNSNTLEAEIRGITVNGFEVVEIKAVTYASVAITCDNKIWSTDIIFDI